jgi:acid phosphatase (class A)
MPINFPRVYQLVFFCGALLFGFTASPDLCAASHSSGAANPGTLFLRTDGLDMAKILPPTPTQNSPEEKRDTSYLKYAVTAATENQKLLGIAASLDSVFDYSMTLGLWFNPKITPKAAALFAKVTSETNEAVEIAKKHFKRHRPNTWKAIDDLEMSDGYCYPSGHTTRAYVWATLLANAFPDERKPLDKQARQKAWYRVILGRHYPSDVRAGKTFGTFLAAQFLKNPAFIRDWSVACSEMRIAREETIPPSSFHP